jgi:hypothetical protein
VQYQHRDFFAHLELFSRLTSTGGGMVNVPSGAIYSVNSR